VLELGDLDLDEIASALADQTDYEHRWLIHLQTGEITIWTSDTGIDGHPVDLDELDLVCIDPLPSYVWYRDMAEFAERISDDRAGHRLARAIEGPRAQLSTCRSASSSSPASGSSRVEVPTAPSSASPSCSSSSVSTSSTNSSYHLARRTAAVVAAAQQQLLGDQAGQNRLAKANVGDGPPSLGCVRAG
jgi:hypothetical protein